MSPAQERQYLRALLKGLDNAESAARTARRKFILAWFGLAFVCAAANVIEHMLSRLAMELLFVIIGAAAAGAHVYIAAGRSWSVLKPYVHREAVEARLRELGGR
jgi:hypothetical protein